MEAFSTLRRLPLELLLSKMVSEEHLPKVQDQPQDRHSQRRHLQSASLRTGFLLAHDHFLLYEFRFRRG